MFVYDFFVEFVWIQYQQKKELAFFIRQTCLLSEVSSTEILFDPTEDIWDVYLFKNRLK